MKIAENKSLKRLNTLRIQAHARYFAVVSSTNDLQKLLQEPRLKDLSKLILGEGSNLLLTQDFNGIVIKNEIKGERIISESEETVVVEFGAGESWINLVENAVDRNWGGVENLSLIPGTVGAAPVQNIAAYGQNLSDVFISLDAINLNTGELTTFTKNECEFSYRQSVFKGKLKNQFFIVSVRLEFAKNPNLETGYYSIGGRYDSVEAELEKISSPPYHIKDVAQAVINIRQRKLPDWKRTPTVGSFFINPTITVERYLQLKTQIPELQSYPLQNLTYTKESSINKTNLQDLVKIPAGRLLDSLSWGKKKIGNCSTYKGWASIITHNGKASGKEILDYTKAMKSSVDKAYKVNLDTEVSVI